MLKKSSSLTEKLPRKEAKLSIRQPNRTIEIKSQKEAEVLTVIEGLDCQGYGGRGRILWKCVTRSLLRFLWNERNSIIFSDKGAYFNSF